MSIILSWAFKTSFWLKLAVLLCIFLKSTPNNSAIPFISWFLSLPPGAAGPASRSATLIDSKLELFASIIWFLSFESTIVLTGFIPWIAVSILFEGLRSIKSLKSTVDSGMFIALSKLTSNKSSLPFVLSPILSNIPGVLSGKLVFK